MPQRPAQVRLLLWLVMVPLVWAQLLGAKQLGAEKIIIMSRNPERQALAKQFGATHVVEEAR